MHSREKTGERGVASIAGAVGNLAGKIQNRVDCFGVEAIDFVRVGEFVEPAGVKGFVSHAGRLLAPRTQRHEPLSILSSMDVTRAGAAELLRSGEFAYLRVLWCDTSNTIRFKAMHLPSLAGRIGDRDICDALDHAVEISAACQVLPLMRDEPVAGTGIGPTHDVRLVPDWSSLTALPWTLGTSGENPEAAPRGSLQVIGNLVDGSAPWAMCPRDLLKRAIKTARNQNVEFQTGAELEFFLLKGRVPGEWEPADHAAYATTVAAERVRPVIDEISAGLWQQGIPIHQYLSESGPGQHEISLHHCDPLTLADRIIAARETVRAVATAHGLTASFAPVVFEESASSGLHVHLSPVLDSDAGIAAAGSEYGISETGLGIVTGLLDHLVALTALSLPTTNSRRRLRPQAWAGTFQGWGVANKEVPVRACGFDERGLPSNIEFKALDASANPYLALAGICAAATDGIAGTTPVPPPLSVDPATLSAAERDELGIEELPQTVAESVNAFEADTVLQDLFGAYADVYAAVISDQAAEMGDLTFAQERDLLLQRY